METLPSEMDDSGATTPVFHPLVVGIGIYFMTLYFVASQLFDTSICFVLLVPPVGIFSALRISPVMRSLIVASYVGSVWVLITLLGGGPLRAYPSLLAMVYFGGCWGMIGWRMAVRRGLAFIEPKASESHSARWEYMLVVPAIAEVAGLCLTTQTVMFGLRVFSAAAYIALGAGVSWFSISIVDLVLRRNKAETDAHSPPRRGHTAQVILITWLICSLSVACILLRERGLLAAIVLGTGVSGVIGLTCLPAIALMKRFGWQSTCVVFKHSGTKGALPQNDLAPEAWSPLLAFWLTSMLLNSGFHSLNRYQQVIGADKLLIQAVPLGLFLGGFAMTLVTAMTMDRGAGRFGRLLMVYLSINWVGQSINSLDSSSEGIANATASSVFSIIPLYIGTTWLISLVERCSGRIVVASQTAEIPKLSIMKLMMQTSLVACMMAAIFHYDVQRDDIISTVCMACMMAWIVRLIVGWTLGGYCVSTLLILLFLPSVPFIWLAIAMGGAGGLSALALIFGGMEMAIGYIEFIVSFYGIIIAGGIWLNRSGWVMKG